MEFLGYIIVAIILFLIKGKNLSTAVDSAFGDAIEELLEIVVKRIFPNNSAVLYGVGQRRKALCEKIKECYESLDSEERKELIDFLNNETRGEIVAVNAFVKKTDVGIQIDENKLSTFLKENKKNIGDIQFKNIKKMSVEEVSQTLFGTSEVPATISEIICIVEEYFFEIKYMGMSADDRDIVKVIQCMIEESHTHILKSIKPYFDLILQQNVQPAIQGEAVQILKSSKSVAQGSPETYQEAVKRIAERDPFSWVRLECPDCYASGTWLRREGDTVHCSKCGLIYSAIRNVPDTKILEYLEEIKTGLEERCFENSQEQTEEMKASVASELSHLAEKMVSADYIDGKLQSMADKCESDIQNAVQKAINLITTERKEKCQTLNAAIQNVAYQIEFNNRTLLEMKTSLYYIETGVVDVSKHLISMAEASGTNQQEVHTMLQEILGRLEANGRVEQEGCAKAIFQIKELIKSLKHSQEEAQSQQNAQMYPGVKCPRCQKQVDFKPKGKMYQCSCCGLAVREEDLRNGLIAPDLSVWILQKDRCGVFMSVTDKCRDKDTVVVKISSSGLIENLNRIDGDLNVCWNQLNPRRCVLISDRQCNVGVEFIWALCNFKPSIRKIVLGNNVNAKERTFCASTVFVYKDGIIQQKSKGKR